MGSLAILHVAYGISYLLFPFADVNTASKLLVGFLACSGTIKLLLSARLYPSRGWVRIAFNGYVSLILAFLLLLFNASITAWILGLILGFDLMFYSGWLILIYSNSHTKRRSLLKNEKIYKANSQCGNNVIYYNFKRD